MENLMHGELGDEVVVTMIRREERMIKDREAMEWKRLVNGVEQR